MLLKCWFIWYPFKPISSRLFYICTFLSSSFGVIYLHNLFTWPAHLWLWWGIDFMYHVDPKVPMWQNEMKFHLHKGGKNLFDSSVQFRLWWGKGIQGLTHKRLPLRHGLFTCWNIHHEVYDIPTKPIFCKLNFAHSLMNSLQNSPHRWARFIAHQ